MLRNINTDILIKHNLDAHQYMILFLLLEQKYDVLDEYLNNTHTLNRFEADINYLNSRDLVSLNPNSPLHAYPSIKVDINAVKILGKYSDFEDLYYKYPIKVTRPNGKLDYLRKDKVTAEQIYSILVKNNRDVHDHIMKCLMFELKEKEKNNSLSYMKTLVNWLSDQEWKNYEDIVDDNIQANDDYLYGTDIE